ncbi:hypothetical protein BBG47_06600 [Paenibacillus sp. KS1]|uniref:methyl-accepting chemotaxis protein n=1 Tax=Paenibacillus sp. KS1 TaxID=1849249 RepID=UPI000806710E|nr:methyl-accepting chemotaxis protein [Paenibacillus sp. KS1]OBY80381.1 hypothetical protein BBG47_06600 [Paenibacillus sp. KS1]
MQKVSDGTASQKRTTVEAATAMNEMAIGITRVAEEHGRGFSVVAQEIGELAEETSSSGRSISDLLIDIRSLVGETVSAMDSIQIETNMGMESIERTKEGDH